MDPVTLMLGGIVVLFGVTIYCLANDGDTTPKLEEKKRKLLTGKPADDFNKKLRRLTDEIVPNRLSDIKAKLPEYVDRKLMVILQRRAEVDGKSSCCFPLMKNIMLMEGKDFSGDPGPQNSYDRELLPLVADELELLFSKRKVAYKRINKWSGDIYFEVKW